MIYSCIIIDLYKGVQRIILDERIFFLFLLKTCEALYSRTSLYKYVGNNNYLKYYSFKRKFMLASNNGIIMVNRTCVSLKAKM